MRRYIPEQVSPEDRRIGTLQSTMMYHRDAGARETARVELVALLAKRAGK